MHRGGQSHLPMVQWCIAMRIAKGAAPLTAWEDVPCFPIVKFIMGVACWPLHQVVQTTVRPLIGMEAYNLLFLCRNSREEGQSSRLTLLMLLLSYKSEPRVSGALGFPQKTHQSECLPRSKFHCIQNMQHVSPPLKFTYRLVL